MNEMPAEAQGAWWRSLFRDSPTCSAWPGEAAAPWMVIHSKSSKCVVILSIALQQDSRLPRHAGSVYYARDICDNIALWSDGHITVDDVISCELVA